MLVDLSVGLSIPIVPDKLTDTLLVSSQLVASSTAIGPTNWIVLYFYYSITFLYYDIAKPKLK